MVTQKGKYIRIGIVVLLALGMLRWVTSPTRRKSPDEANFTTTEQERAVQAEPLRLVKIDPAIGVGPFGDQTKEIFFYFSENIDKKTIELSVEPSDFKISGYVYRDYPNAVVVRPKPGYKWEYMQKYTIIVHAGLEAFSENKLTKDIQYDFQDTAPPPPESVWEVDTPHGI